MILILVSDLEFWGFAHLYVFLYVFIAEPAKSVPQWIQYVS